MKKTQLKLFSFLTMLTFSLGSQVMADDSQLMSLVQNMESKMNEMSNTIKWQGEKINKLEMAAPGTASPGSMKIDEKDFDENLKRKIGSSDEWLKGLKFNGDFRLRYEGTHNQAKGQTTADNDRNRYRFRLRFGFEKKLSDEWKVGFRLASGPRTVDPTGTSAGQEDIGGINSTNQTLDNNFDFKAISIDRAYATYIPKWAQVGVIKQLEITGGKFKNPFEEGSSMMIWDRDVVPEGVYEGITAKVFKGDNVDVDYKLTAGQMVTEEGSGSERDDAFLMAFQTGFITKVSTSALEKPIEHKVLFSYYDWGGFAAPGNFQGANGNPTCTNGGASSLCAKQFNVIEIYNEIGFEVNPLPKSSVFFDWATNVSDHAPTGVTPEDANDTYGIGIQIGSAKKKGQWEATYGYYNIEPDATPGIFSDSDFGHADRRGSVLRFGYGITDNLQLNTSAFYTNAITGGGLNGDNNRQLYQVDLVWKI